MRINIFLSIIGIALASLIGYLVFNVAEGQENDTLCGIGGIVCFSITLIPTIGIHYNSSRLGINLRVLSALFFVIFFVCNFCFASLGIKTSYYIICNGIILVIYLAILYKMLDIKSI